MMCWKLSYLLCMEFFPCKKTPCSALPCSAAAPGLSSQRCESVLPRGTAQFVSDGRRFLTLGMGAERGEFPWIHSCPAVL